MNIIIIVGGHFYYYTIIICYCDRKVEFILSLIFTIPVYNYFLFANFYLILVPKARVVLFYASILFVTTSQ